LSIIHYSKFSDNPWGNGAEKRTAQIKYLINKLGHNIIDYSELNGEFTVSRFNYYRDGYRYLKQHHFPLKSRHHIARTGLEICNKKLSIQAINDKKVLIWESSRFSDHKIPYISKITGVHVIAMPHNLESLVPSQKSLVTNKEGLEWLEEEIDLLKFCSIIFTISMEEQWLLSLLKLKAVYLPYFPVPELEEFLLNIRTKRSKKSKNGYFLMLGTALNPPTKQGFIDFINYFNTSKSQIKLIVAGYATEMLLKEMDIDPKKIELIGSVSNERLEDLLFHCKALIVNQRPSSGALTKLQEMRIAGIPVIANHSSLRSYHNISGIHPFKNFAELEQILVNDDLDKPELPTRDFKAETKFIKLVQEYLG